MSQTGNVQQNYIQTLREIIREEGVFGLWRGNFVSCFRAFPSKAILFATNDFYKTALQNQFVASAKLNRRSKPPFWVSFFGGAFAGLTALVVTYPLDIVRTRLTATLFANKSMQNGNSVKSKSMVKTFVNIIRYEGVLGLYKGVTPSLIGAVPYEGIKFLSFDLFKASFTSLELAVLKTETSSISVLEKLVCGALAGATAGIVLYPNDTIRKNMQMENVGRREGSQEKSSMLRTAMRLYREGGSKRFFKGLIPYIIRVAPNSAIQFGVYESLKMYLE